MADTRHAQGTLNIGFKYSGPISHGDDVEIGADRVVSSLKTIGSPKRVGAVAAIDSDLSMCTVETSFRGQRHDRVAGESVDPGFFIAGPAGEAYQFTPASPARCDGTAVGPVTITAGTNDAIKLTVEGGADQTATLTAGAGRTFAAIAAEVNALLTGIVLEVDVAGHLNPVCKEIGKKFTIGAVDHDAYTTLGWTAGDHVPTNASHDPALVTGLIVVGAAKGQNIETLEW